MYFSKERKCCYARCRKESNVCIQYLGKSKEDCEIFFRLSGPIGDARRHTPRANISKVAAYINCTQEPCKMGLGILAAIVFISFTTGISLVFPGGAGADRPLLDISLLKHPCSLKHRTSFMWVRPTEMTLLLLQASGKKTGCFLFLGKAGAE